MPVADEQERNQARQLPEDDELDEVAGDNDAEHRAHEREEERVEARHRILRRHVVARVERDERADDGDEHARTSTRSHRSETIRSSPSEGTHEMVSRITPPSRTRGNRLMIQTAATTETRPAKPASTVRVGRQERRDHAAEERQEQQGDQRHDEHSNWLTAILAVVSGRSIIREWIGKSAVALGADPVLATTCHRLHMSAVRALHLPESAEDSCKRDRVHDAHRDTR